jgi:exodeoxyribonuclease VII large subunit
MASQAVSNLSAVTVPLFDADAGTGAPRRVTLVRLSGEIARSLVAVGRVAVEGEVYRPVGGRTGNVYFTLRDRVAQMDVRVPSAVARRGRVAAGERVSVVGALQWVNERGQVQMVAEEVLPVGAGAIAALIEATRSRLAADGLLDRRRRPIPVLPTRIGIVCGTEAAVRKDIESVIVARCPGYPVQFLETTVSGPAASVSIVDALEALAVTAGVEVIIMARGGGDAPSLLPWSTEEVCRAVAACPVPVVSAIGHDGDRPLCDEVADLRCGTPSLAATTVLPDLRGLSESIDTMLATCSAAVASRMDRGTQRLARVDVRRAVVAGVDSASSRLSLAGARLSGVHPGDRLRSCADRLSGIDWRRPFWEAYGRAAGQLTADHRHLQVLSPQRTLARGYAVVSGPDGSVLRTVDGLVAGDSITAQLAEGRLEATVKTLAVTGSPPAWSGSVSTS